jgi:hypothetical protein
MASVINIYNQPTTHEVESVQGQLSPLQKSEWQITDTPHVVAGHIIKIIASLYK